MAVNTWYQSWSPPHGLFPEEQTTFHAPAHVTNFTDVHQSQRSGDRITDFSKLLPFFLQLGLLDPPPPPNPVEKTGPFQTWYQWKVLDYQFLSEDHRLAAIASEIFIPENNLPLGLEVHEDKLFITMPKWKPGVPATLAVLPRKPQERSPKLVPYPDWESHSSAGGSVVMEKIAGSCEGMTSVFRVQADTCNRLWVLDSGQIDVTIKPQQVCPPQILVFDLATDKLLLRYPLPEEFIKQDSLYSNIAVDIRDDDCVNVHAYLTDVWRYGLVVFSLEKMRSWRVTDHLFYPEPLSAAYNLHGLEFEWVDGIFGLALSPYNKKAQDRLLYFHPMSSFREFYVKTSVICNETGWNDVKDAFKVIGQSRGQFGHVSASGMDRDGVMFFNMVTRDSVGCWDSRKPYKRDNIAIVARSTKTLVFPNDLKIDNEPRQSVWVLSNKLPFYLYRSLSKNAINFRVMSAFVDEAIGNSICNPQVKHFDTFRSYPDGEDCY